MDAQGIIDNIKSVKSQDTKFHFDSSKGTITATVIGAGIGLLIAYNRKWSLLMGAVIGGTITGLASNYLIKKK